MTDTTGSCLCGAITIQADLKNLVGACHCDICRTWGGGPMFALDGGNEVRFEGQECISTHPSTEWAERGFCSRCGTHLFIKVNQSGRYILPTGLFDRVLPNLVFDHQIFVDQRPSYYRFANETREQTGAEVFAEFASDQSD